MAIKICVLGAGIVGLASAVNIQERIPSATVRIIADKFGAETTSAVAAGIFLPRFHVTSASSPQLFRKWVKDSWDFYNSLYRSEQAKDAGVTQLNGHIVFTEQPSGLTFEDYIFSIREVSKNEAEKLGFKNKFVYAVSTLLTESRYYMAYLMKRFLRNGGETIQRTVKSFNELCGEYDLVLNCTGLGSRTLCKDQSVVAQHGQLAMVRAPWVKNFLYFETGGSLKSYIIPCREAVAVGGLKEKGKYELAPSMERRNLLLKNATEYLPSLAGAEVLWDVVGLRPFRSVVRLEPEVVQTGSGELQVIHNYGHGSNGVGLSWGCGKHAAQLATDLLRKSTKQPELLSKL